MSAAFPCIKSKLINGLFVRVASSNDSKVICTVANRTDIKHTVEIKNLGGYPANVRCEGHIRSNPKKLKF